jgi:hypothetical protein
MKNKLFLLMLFITGSVVFPSLKNNNVNVIRSVQQTVSQ